MVSVRGRGAQVGSLTGVGDSDPGCNSHDVPSGICSCLESIGCRVCGQHIRQGQDIAEQPHSHDGQHNLKWGGMRGTPRALEVLFQANNPYLSPSPSPSSSPSTCSSPWL